MSSVEAQPRSVSQTEQYEKCGWRFYLQRVERVTPRPAAWSFHGTAFHAAAEAVEKSGRAIGEEEAVQIFSDRYSALVNEALNREPDTDRWLAAGHKGGEDIERRYTLGQKHTAEYVRWADRNQPEIWNDSTWNGYDISEADLSVTEGIELYFMVELGGVKVRGYIDQLVLREDGKVRPRDLKTGSTKSKFQLWTYGFAARKAWGLDVEDADWYLAKDGRLSRPVRMDATTEQEIERRYADMDAGVKRGDFPANPGFDCKFCDLSHACRFSRG